MFRAEGLHIVHIDPRVPLDEARPPAFTDEALALRFAELMPTICATSRHGRGGCIGRARIGSSTTRLLAFDLARAVCREAAADVQQARDRNGARERENGRTRSSDSPRPTAGSLPPSTNGTPTHGC